MSLDPITREEMYLAAAAGYDVTPPEPVTRKEIFLAQLAGMEVETPVPFTRRERFLEAAAVAANRAVIEPLDITKNGTYTAPEGVDGYNPVTVNVAGSSADLRYVTFMSYDGLVEYGKKAVAVGDDCADPIARGIFATPTRESDVQYNYTFYGWATEPNGGADANWNKAVTEDKTVYANFSKTVRYYTITYYDSDGTTVLKTESLAYGSMPNYAPIKDGVTFGGWTPEITTVTGNTSYTATWEEKITFAGSSWTKITEISEAGEAKKYFAIGDTKTIIYKKSDTVSYEITLVIADFDHDTLYDGSGTAGMTIDCTMTPTSATVWGTDSSTYYNIANCRKFLKDEALPALPEDLVAVIKNVGKVARISSSNAAYTFNDTLFLYSIQELGFESNDITEIEGTIYPIFENIDNRIARKMSDGTAVPYWTRSSYIYNGKVKPLSISQSGKDIDYTNMYSSTNYIRFGFCV